MFTKAARASAVRAPSNLKNTLLVQMYCGWNKKCQQVKNMEISDIFSTVKKMFEREENEQCANFFGFSDALGNHWTVG